MGVTGVVSVSPGAAGAFVVENIEPSTKQNPAAHPTVDNLNGRVCMPVSPLIPPCVF
jgi:hypothetical protein